MTKNHEKVPNENHSPKNLIKVYLNFLSTPKINLSQIPAIKRECGLFIYGVIKIGFF